MVLFRLQRKPLRTAERRLLILQAMLAVLPEGAERQLGGNGTPTGPCESVFLPGVQGPGTTPLQDRRRKFLVLQGLLGRGAAAQGAALPVSFAADAKSPSLRVLQGDGGQQLLHRR